MFFDVISKERNEKNVIKFHDMSPLIMLDMLKGDYSYSRKDDGDSLFNKMLKCMVASDLMKNIFK